MVLNGSRIINLQNLQQHIQTITSHTASCHPSTDKPSNEQQTTVTISEKHREGLSSLLTPHCTNCRKEFPLKTSSRVKDVSGKHCWESNIAAVWGQISTGAGHSTLVETMAVLGIPTMTKKSFIASERKIGEWWWALLKKSMKLAGEEEKAVAIAQCFHCRRSIPIQKIVMIVMFISSLTAHCTILVPDPHEKNLTSLFANDNAHT